MPRSLQGVSGAHQKCRHAEATQPSAAGLAHSTSHHKYPGRTRSARHGSQGRSTLIGSLACWQPPCTRRSMQALQIALRCAPIAALPPRAPPAAAAAAPSRRQPRRCTHRPRGRAVAGISFGFTGRLGFGGSNRLQVCSDAWL